MLSATVHVCLVSAQAAANLLPALDRDLKPRKALLVVSGKMRSHADSLERVLNEAGVKTDRVELDDEHDFQRIQEVLLRAAAQYENDRLALNLTGGTKLMALAAHSIATTAGWEVFYVDIDTDEALFLGEGSLRKRLNAHLRLPHYLRSYGYEPREESRPQQLDRRWIDLARTLIVQAGSLQQPVAQLNWLAQQAEAASSLRMKLSPEQVDSPDLEALLRNFEDAGVIKRVGQDFEFPSEAHRAFATGGWLEHCVFRAVSALSADLDIRDKSMGLCVVDRSGVKNELDVTFIARNRLFVIECKTARMDGARAVKANDALFKLAEICRRIGGLGTRAMLVSYRLLDEAERRLARALNVELVCGPELIRLEEKLKCWVRS